MVNEAKFVETTRTVIFRNDVAFGYPLKSWKRKQNFGKKDNLVSHTANGIEDPLEFYDYL